MHIDTRVTSSCVILFRFQRNIINLGLDATVVADLQECHEYTFDEDKIGTEGYCKMLPPCACLDCHQKTGLKDAVRCCLFVLL